MKTTVNITPKGIAIETDDMIINIESKSSSLEKVEDLFKGILKMDAEKAPDYSKAFAKTEPPKIKAPVKKTINNHKPIEPVRKCAVCGNEFKPKNRRSTCCSKECMRHQANAKYSEKQKKLPEVKQNMPEVKKEPANAEASGMYDPETNAMFGTKGIKY